MTTAATGFQTVLTVPERFRGPEGTANGGWIAGRLASALTGAGHDSAVEVTLRLPVPLETELAVEHVGNAVTLRQGDRHLAEAVPVRTASPEVPFVSFLDAARAEDGFPAVRDQSIAGCFACGSRAPGDGLRIFPGPVGGAGDLVAAGWRVPSSVAGEDGTVPGEIVWAALDCVTGWAHYHAMGEGPALLGRLTARVFRPVHPFGAYSVVARATGRDGRKLYGDSAVYEGDGTLVAAAEAVWIMPR